MISVNGYALENGHFPDGTTNMNLNGMPAYPAPTESVDILWNYENDAELFQIICLAKKFDKHIKHLTFPYVPNARMDRVKREGDVFTLKYFCEIINSLNFETVYIRDPHSNVTPALLNNCVIENASQYITRVISLISEDNLIAFYPDEGAMKRYSDQSPLPYAFGVKSRDWVTGKINNLTIIDNGIDIRGRSVLVIDDICSYGGTFVRAAEKLREMGAAHIYLYVTHCEQNIFKGKLYNENYDLVDKVFTSELIGYSDGNMPANFYIV